MAEPVRRRSYRKRTQAPEEEASIVQLSFAELCGCAKCWKTAVLRPLARPSGGKKAKQTGGETTDHERQDAANSFVYEGRGVRLPPTSSPHSRVFQLSSKLGCSADGRYAFAFTHAHDLLIVDITRNARK
jgi:hypothetical protein